MFLKAKKLLVNPEKPENDARSWAVVILKPLRQEVKTALIQLVAKTFNLSLDEATTVMENTPIILLDRLTQSIAVRVKDYFRSTGAEIFLSNDPVVKSKCFRTVWPDLPDLSFIQQEDISPEEAELAEQIPPKMEKPALVSIFSKSIVQNQTKLGMPISAESKPQAQSQSQNTAQSQSHSVPKTSKQLARDFEFWKEKYESWKASFQGLTDDVNRLRADRQEIEEKIKESDSFISEQGKTQQEQNEILGSMQNSCEALQKEYQDSRGKFEKQLTSFEEEAAGWRAKIRAMTEKIVDLDQQKQKLDVAFQEQNQKCEELQEAYRQLRSIFEQKIRQSSQELDQWKSGADEMGKRLVSLEENQGALEKVLNVQRDKFLKLEDSYQQVQALVQEKLDDENDLEAGYAREKKMAEKLDSLEKLQIQVMQDLQERIERDQLFQAKVSQWDKELKDLRTSQEELRKKILSNSQTKRQKQTSVPEENEVRTPS